MANVVLGSSIGHGQVDRGLFEAADATAQEAVDRPRFEGKFGRMFPKLRGAAFFMRDMESLAGAMGAERDDGDENIVDAEENMGLPSGYTYFGQFVDHDITLDAVSLSMKKEDPSAVVNFRTPALDLDCLYGRGPDDQPFMYEDGIRFLMGDRELTAGPGGPVTTLDLPRASNRRAIIGDKRNDENTIVSQLQGLFLQFHNRVSNENPRWSFEEVRQSVQWHYQWLVLYDYLPRIVGREMVMSILPHLQAAGPVSATPPVIKFYDMKNTASLPVEFSGAAYRFGHSMVRPQYRLNRSNDIGLGGRVPVFAPKREGSPSVDNPGLNGFGDVPTPFGIEWHFLFETEGRTLATDFVGPDRIQPAYKIDTSLVFPLARLPEFSDDQGNPNPPLAVNRLALRNLMRGMKLSLPSGQEVARAMGERVLTDDELLVGKAEAEHFDDPEVGKITDPWKDNPADTGRTSMQDSAPLWFYILAEARHRWKEDAAQAVAAAGAGLSPEQRDAIIDATPTRLGKVGGRIVAETLIGLAYADKSSFLHANPGFTPSYGDPAKPVFERFTVGDVATFVNQP